MNIKFSAKILLLWITIISSSVIGGKHRFGGFGGFGGKDYFECEECSFLVDDAIEDIKQLLGEVEPRYFEGNAPCKECQFTGASSFERNGRACTVKKDADCYIQIIPLKFANLSISCNCSMPVRLDKLMEIFSKGQQIKDENFCKFPLDKDDLPFGKHQFKPKFDSTVAKCSVPAGLTHMFGKEEEAKAVATASWKNFEVVLKLKVCPEIPSTVKKLGILSDNFDDLDATCAANDAGKESCECVTESNLMKSTIVHIAETAIPCAINTRVSEVRDITEKLRCK